MSAIGEVNFNIKNKIAEVEFYHPKGNSLPGSLLKELAGKIMQASEDAGTSVIILKSSGEKAFCAGASFDELSELRTEDESISFFRGFADVIYGIISSPKPVIGRVHGKAAGGGVGLIGACDYVMAHSKAEVCLSELELGIGPFVIAPVLEKKIGKAALFSMTLDVFWRSAEWCLEKGLYSQIFEFAKDLDEEIINLAERLCKYSPEALSEVKKLMWYNPQEIHEEMINNAKISGRLALGKYTQEFIKKFREK